MAKSTRPSIRLVAERARVSVATVSNVINDKPTVSPEIVARVRQAVKELGYVVDISASRLRSGRRWHGLSRGSRRCGPWDRRRRSSRSSGRLWRTWGSTR